MRSTLPANPTERNALFAQLIAAVRDGKSFAQLAEEFGHPASTINNWLLSKVPDEYRDAQEFGVVARITEQVEKLETATNHLEVARAREAGRLWCWLGERVVQRLAPKQEISGPGGGPIQVLDAFQRAQRFAFLQSQVMRDPIDVEPVAEQHEKQALTELSTEKQAE